MSLYNQLSSGHCHGAALAAYSGRAMDIMNPIKADSISPATKAWFGNQIQRFAMRHDITGPDIRQVILEEYKRKLIYDLRSRARVASDTKELQITSDEIDMYCRLAAEELIRMRQIRAAHKAGELPTEVLRQLPAYEAFRDYFEEAPSLVHEQVIATVKDLFESGNEDADSEPLSQPGHPKHPVSKPTRAWMEFQAVGLACADDAWGAPFGAVPQEDYITDSTLRIRRNARRAIRMGELQVPAEDVDNICWVAACEAYLLRSLGAAMDSGRLSYQEIKEMPIYGPYHEYFEKEPGLIAMAERVAVAAGLPIRPPDSRN